MITSAGAAPAGAGASAQRGAGGGPPALGQGTHNAEAAQLTGRTAPHATRAPVVRWRREGWATPSPLPHRLVCVDKFTRMMLMIPAAHVYARGDSDERPHMPGMSAN